MTTVTGILDAIRHERPSDKGTWLVAELIPDAKASDFNPGRLLTIKGTIAGKPSIGGSYRLTGDLQENPPYGKQFCFLKAESVRPASLEGIRRYIEATLKHIGPATSKAIVDEFGEETLSILDRDPSRLLGFKGITPDRLATIQADWAESTSAREATVELCKLGLTQGQIGRIVTAYGSPSRALDQIRSNPYSLIDDVDGVGWARADHLGDRMGITHDDPRRARAAAYHVLTEAAGEGHTYLPEAQIVERAKKLDVTAEAIKEGARDHHQIVTSEVNESQGWYALVKLFAAEEDAAWKLKVMLGTQPVTPGEMAERPKAPVLSIGGDGDITPGFESQSLRIREIGLAAHLDEDQQCALLSACQHRVSIITGGPGTGKTTSIKAILQAWHEVLGLQIDNKRPSICEVALAAPTGKAAQRLSESTGQDAQTIHRLLGWAPYEVENADGRLTHFTINSATPFREAKAIILDETSMVDIELLRDLCDALTADHRLLLVGDIDQLPSVGPGAVLRDLIDSGAIPVARLHRIHRQDAGSSIISSAHAVNHGEVPAINNDSDGNVKYYRYPTTQPNGDDIPPARTAQGIADGILALIADPRGLVAQLEGIDPIRDVQVLCPGKAGACGTIALNHALQAALNPPAPDKPELRIGGWGDDDRDGNNGNGNSQNGTKKPTERILRLGDRVIQTRNDYKLDVMNGDVGVITALVIKDTTGRDPTRTKDLVRVTFDDGGSVVYEGVNSCFSLHLAYALTVHKSQGSEYPIVILPVHTTHAMLLKRNLIYTAITRAKDFCIILGTDKALGMAVRNNQEEKRFTFLREFMRHPK